MKLLLAILLLSCSAKSQIVFGVATADLPPINFASKKIAFFGNSITYGVDATDTSLRWTSLFSNAKAGIQENYGVSGATMQNVGTCSTYPFSPLLIPTFTSAYAACFFSFGTNDVGWGSANGFDTAGFITDYVASIKVAQGRGWPINRIIVLDLYKPLNWATYTGGCSGNPLPDAARVTGYRTAIARVVFLTGCRFVAIYDAMNAAGLNSTYYAGDGLHESDLGHAFIANYLLSVLK